MKDLLIEIGCEDLPARFVKPLAEALANAFYNGLKDRGLYPQQIPESALRKWDQLENPALAFATPRRIAVLLSSIPDRQPNQIVERKGPKAAAAIKDGQPTPAGLGFAKSCGVEFSQLQQEGDQLVFRQKQKGRKTVELIPQIFEEALKAMDALVPKRMRWGSGEETFVRPVEWLLALFGNQVIPLQRFGLTAGRLTYGHRFHAPKAIKLKSPADYEAVLNDAKVWADFASRRDEIERQIKAEAVKLGGTPKIDAGLLDEVTALVEWPVVISGRIEERFLELPPEVIVATVETNQRYFTVFDAVGKLLPSFITIANIESKDVAQVISGNERVVRPRLSDALFFWHQDLKPDLESYSQKLDSVSYQKELGSIADKVKRIHFLTDRIGTSLARIHPELLGQKGANAARAANLCKSDLVTRMVYEFPELQGLMGGYYAVKSGEPESVSRAIAEHYRPTQSGSPIPSTIEGQIVALADKLDTLAGIFAIGQKPTASKDPYALRRAALGVLRILIEGKLPLDLASLLESALEAQPAGKRDATTLNELIDFVMERLRGYYVEQQLPSEMFEAVKALGITEPLDFDMRVQALRAFWALDSARQLAAAHKRVRNILKQAGETSAVVDAVRFTHPAERALAAKLGELQMTGDYAAQLSQLASLREPVDAFFDMRAANGEPVMVNDPDPAIRSNRLALLAQLDKLCRSVADISLLPG